MNEATWLCNYVAARDNNDPSTRRALFHALPVLLIRESNPTTDLFVDMLALLPVVSLKDDFLILFPNYWSTVSYSIMATAVDSVMEKKEQSLQKAKILQSSLV